MDWWRFALLSFLLATAPASGSPLKGIVVDGDARPVSSADVQVYAARPKVGISPLCPSCYVDCGKRDRVDPKGAFAFEAVDRGLLFDVLAVAPGYEPAIVRNVDPVHGSVTIRLARRSAEDRSRLITGRVFAPDGTAVVGALVEPSGYHVDDMIGYGNIPGIDRLSITDSRGEFALRIPEADGALDVRITTKSYAPRIERMLSPRESRRIFLTEGATITGRLTERGRPAAGARIAFVQRNRASAGYLGRVETGTREDGTFAMTNLAANETYVVHVPMAGLADAVVQPKLVTTGTAGTIADAGELVIEKGRRLAGRIVMPDGAPVPPATRMVIENGIDADWREIEVRADGRFDVNAAPTGEVRLIARIPRFRLVTPDDAHGIGVPPGGDVTNIRLRFER